MAYKAGYRPVERLGAEGWVRFDPDAGVPGLSQPSV
jgi:arginyl-tRNA--protein-N-Asp/Glu arginylyltransferase